MKLFVAFVEDKIFGKNIREGVRSRTIKTLTTD